MRQIGNITIKLPLVIATLVGLFLAFYLGRQIGTGQSRFMVIFFGSCIVGAVVLAMGKNIWMLLPACWELSGKISVLPLPFSVRDLSIFLVAGVYLVMFAFKMIRQKPIVDHLNVLLWINLGYLVTVFVRNPVGVAAMNADLVGGKPYFVIATALVPYFVLSRIVVPAHRISLIPFLLLGASIIVTVLGVLTNYIPSLVPFIAPFYDGISIGTYLDEYNGSQNGPGDLGETRLTVVAGLGGTLAAICIAFWPPKTLFNPLYLGRFFLFMSALGMTFLGGFRSALISIMVTIIISSYLRGKVQEVLHTIIPLIAGIVLLVSLQGTVLHLPNTVQRTLSFLPGAWDDAPMDDAQGSTDWRVEMWKTALTTDRYIKNKLLGDGFGFTKADLEIMKSSAFGGAGFGGVDAAKESFMIQGSFHSGPVSAIRYAGVVGLVLILILLCSIAAQAYRLVQRAKGTPFFITTLFVSIPAIFAPFSYVFIFGSYDSALTGSMFTIGMLKMIELSLAKSVEKESEILLQKNDPRPSGGAALWKGQRRSETSLVR